MKKTLRVLSVVLCVLLLVGIMPLSASAAKVNLNGAGMSRISDVESTLAPGVTLNEVKAYRSDGRYAEMFLAVADLNNEDVKVQTSYYNDGTEWSMSKLSDQVAAANANHADEDYAVVAAVNASFYNMTTGRPTGAFYKYGVDGNGANPTVQSFFAILKDGTPYIGRGTGSGFGGVDDYTGIKDQIEEATGGHTLLIWDDTIQVATDTTAGNPECYPRSAVGVTADNKVVLLNANGSSSVTAGITLWECAQILHDAGCVKAIRLDEGGSATFGVKREGTDNFAIINSPSDGGSERPISTGILIASTAAASGEFDHAIVSASSDYVTPNSTVQFTATGADAAGGPAEIPADAEWTLADASYGSIDANGLFTSTGSTGDVTAQLTIPDPDFADNRTVLFTKPGDWGTPYVYYWSDEDEHMVNWPGVAMTYYDTNDYGQDRYKFTMPAGATKYIISNYGSNQTANLDFTGNTGVYLDNGAVTYPIGDKVVGEATISVVVPDIAFTNSDLTVPYGKHMTLPIKATTNNGNNKVTVKPADFVFEVSQGAGYVDGFEFYACEESSGLTTGTITMTSAYDNTKTATANLTFGKGSEIVYDFEGAQATTDGWSGQSRYYKNRNQDVNNRLYGRMERGYVEIVDETTGKVHAGDHAMALTVDYSAATAAGYKGVTFQMPSVSIEGCTAVGMWVYIPYKEMKNCDFALHGRTASDTEPDLSTVQLTSFTHSAQLFALNAAEPYKGASQPITGEGWYYLTANVSGLLTLEGISVNTSDSSRTIINPYDNYTFYVDDITADFSSAVDDRENPIFAGAYISAAADDRVAINGQTITNGNITVVANVADNTTKTNYTGLNYDTAALFVDGLPIDGVTAGNGVITGEVNLTPGVHTIRFEINDNAGNLGFITRKLVVGGADQGAVYLRLAADTPELPLCGSVIWYELVAQDIASVDNICATFKLSNTNSYELDGIETADGFAVTYSHNDANNRLDLYISCVDATDVSAAGEAVVARIPVRIYSPDGYKDPYFINSGMVSTNPGLVDSYRLMTPYGMWYSDGTRVVRVEMEMTGGVVTFVDNSTESIASLDLHTMSEMNRYRADGYYDAQETWHGTGSDTAALRQGKFSSHIHVEGQPQDKAPTCTQPGYTGRIFCVGDDCGATFNTGAASAQECTGHDHDGCGSVIDWGTIIPATGHTYAFVDGVLKCEDCDKLFNGEYTDGKTYVDGVALEGWVDDSYYADGEKLTGIQLVDGYYYDFGDDGVCEDHQKYNGLLQGDDGQWRYSKNGELLGGWVKIGDRMHYFKKFTKVAATGVYTADGVTYLFDEQGGTDGAWHTDDNGTRYYYGGNYYVARNPGTLCLVEIEGETYNFDNDGYITTGIQVLRDSTGFQKFAFDFGDDGKLVEAITDEGILRLSDDEAYYINADGYIPMNYGLVEVDGDYYFVVFSGKVTQNNTKSVTEAQAHGLVPAGIYEFGADGKMIIKNGVYDGYYYENNQIVGGKGLIEFNGDYYFVVYSGKVAKNTTKTIQPSQLNDLPFTPGNYDFDEDGKMIIKNGVVDGYYYENGQVVGGKGLVKDGDDYYFVVYSGKVAKNTTKAVQPSQTNGLLPPGYYYFGADGKLVFDN